MDVKPLRIVAVGASLLVALMAVAAAIQVLRPPVQVTSAADPDVTVECAATTGVNAADCLAWGDALIEGDPPSFTFEMDSLSRLRFDRSWFGLGSACQVSYLISRYAEAAATDEVACVEAP